jgi:hypothetical protein
MIAHFVVCVRFVFCIITHPVPVISQLISFSGAIAPQNQPERSTLHVRRRGDAGETQECGREIYVSDNVTANTASLDLFGVSNHQRHSKSLFVNEALVKPSMFSKKESLIRCIDDNRYLPTPIRIEQFEDSANIVVNALNGTEIRCT